MGDADRDLLGTLLIVELLHFIYADSTDVNLNKLVRQTNLTAESTNQFAAAVQNLITDLIESQSKTFLIDPSPYLLEYKEEIGDDIQAQVCRIRDEKIQQLIDKAIQETVSSSTDDHLTEYLTLVLKNKLPTLLTNSEELMAETQQKIEAIKTNYEKLPFQ